jgi:pimeloyl-ACP methyl ester carboxylesterase
MAMRIWRSINPQGPCIFAVSATTADAAPEAVKKIQGSLMMPALALRVLSLACLTATAILMNPAAQAASPKLETTDVMIPSGDPGIQLFVRNKHPVGMKNFRSDRILLFVHGATYPAETAFDLPIEGVSMMDLIAQRGFDVYLVDVRGYGRSTRPPEMSQPPEANKPIVSTEVAAHDYGVAVDYILKKRGVSKIDVMGWSWGTSIVGLYTSEHNSKVDRLVLYAPQWIRTEPPAANLPPLGAYRLVSKESARERWLKGVPADKQADLIPPGVFDAWADATWATDPEASKHSPPTLRATNGVGEDSRNTWSAGKALYDPSKITVPTLILHAEWDADLPSYLAQNYFKQLTNTPYKRLIELSEGTHTVMMEKNRMQFFHELMGFLDEDKPLALK